MIEVIKKNIVEDLRERCDGKAYLVSSEGALTQSQIADHIENETEEGIRYMTNLIMLTDDLVRRSKKKLQDYDRILTVKYDDSFEITGRGLVLTIHRDSNDFDSIQNGIVIHTPQDGKTWKVIGVEKMRKAFANLEGDNIGLLVKEYKEDE